MDWDDIRPPQTQKAATLGEDITKLAVAELQARIAALEAEIVRVTAELDAKRRQQAAAASLFKS